MSTRLKNYSAFCFLVLCSANGSSALAALPATGNVTTYHNNNSRTGHNDSEVALKRTNVNPRSFGKIGALSVDGQIYAQPLFVQNVGSVRKGYKDLVIVATEHDSVYAFDAKTLSHTPVWKRSFLGDSQYPCKGCVTLKVTDTHAPNIFPEIGITATPVIDAERGVVYVIGTSKDNGIILQKLHALDLGTGKELPGSPVTVSGSVHGMGYGRDINNVIRFNAVHQLSRAGLGLSNGIVYASFSSYDDLEPAHGWVFAYDAKTLKAVHAFITNPDTGLGSIWMSGGAPAIDGSDNIFFSTGNSDAQYLQPLDFGNSILKVGFGRGGLGVLDYFIPYNRGVLATRDVDLGSGGVTILPDQPGAHPHLLVAGGKEGTIYLLDRDNLGHFNSAPGATSNPQVVQEVVYAVPGGKDYGNGIYGTIAYWNNRLLVAAFGDVLRSFPIVNGRIDAAKMTRAKETIALRGATVSVSSNDDQDGIAWLIDPSAMSYSFDAATDKVTLVSDGPAILAAYNPDDLSTPMFRSDKQGAADRAGNAVKFTVPTVAGGKVFVGTDTEVSVYGLLRYVRKQF